MEARNLRLVRHLESIKKKDVSWNFEIWELERAQNEFQSSISAAEKALALVKTNFEKHNFTMQLVKQRGQREDLISEFYGEYIKNFEEARRERKKNRTIPRFKRRYHYWSGYISGLRTIIRLINPLLKSIGKSL